MSDIGIKATSKGIVVLLVVSVLVLLCIGGGAVLFWQKISAATTTMQAKKKQVQDAQRMASTLEESKLEYEDTQSQLQNLEQSISTEVYIPTLLKQVEGLCQSVDMKVLSVRPVRNEASSAKKEEKAKDDGSSESAAKSTDKDKPSQPFYKESKIDIEVGGYYLNSLDLIYRLTNFPKIIAVNSVQMTPAGSDKTAYGSPELKVQMSVTAFILNEDENKLTQPKVSPAVTAALPGRGASNETR